ncbi:MAG: HEAT repeat domain-containing protein, partial [Planctomycetota bacterium]
AASALALGEIADPRALEPVWRIVDDRDRRVRMCAAYAAARLGNDSRLAGIGSELMSGSEPARNMAARLLSRVKGERAASMLLVGLDAPQPGVRAISARGLGRKGLESPEVVRALSARARDPDPLVRRAAAAALGVIATPSSVREIAGFVRDADFGVRLAAFGAIAKAGLAEGAAAAARGLGDPRIEARASAVRALGRVTKQDFGLSEGRGPTEEELRSAVLKAQLWWSEHRGRYEGGEEP